MVMNEAPLMPRRDAANTRPGGGMTVRPRLRRRTRIAACAPGAAREGYRMGRWERLAMTIVVTAAVVVATLTVALRPGEPTTRTVAVQPGETLAAIVARDLPDMDLSRALKVVESINGLGGSAVYAGEVLEIPAR